MMNNMISGLLVALGFVWMFAVPGDRILSASALGTLLIWAIAAVIFLAQWR